jgi:hypothetical protein
MNFRTGATRSLAQLKGYFDSWAATQAYEVPGLASGFALHDELQAMAAAGDRGTVETGKPADLLLPSADPVESVSNTRRLAAVIVGGLYESRPLPTRSLQPEAHEQ